MESKKFKFPPDFIWGASTSAHQVEGGNLNDWSEWERANAGRLASEAESKFAKSVPDWDDIKLAAADPANYISGRAADHYRRFREDIQITKSLGLKAFRFSIEWSRVEPEEGQWNEEALAHYSEVIKELKRAGIEPFVTCWHRTNPVWIARIGDWENPKTVEFFLRFVEKITRNFGDGVEYWMPLNEPIMSLAGGYLGGVYPPMKKSFWKAKKVFANFVRAHNRAYEIIHAHVKGAKVGIPHAMVYVEAYKNRWPNRLLVAALNYLANWRLLDAVRDHLDFIGVQYYSRGLINLNFSAPTSRVKFIEEINEGKWKSDMGWEVYPQGLYHSVKKVSARYPEMPIIITENGITDARDVTRGRFIREHLAALHRAMEEGAKVKGYFYWSLLDNLEWDKGFWPRFGLVEVNYKNFERKIRPSGYEYAKIIKEGGF